MGYPLVKIQYPHTNRGTTLRDRKPTFPAGKCSLKPVRWQMTFSSVGTDVWFPAKLALAQLMWDQICLLVSLVQAQKWNYPQELLMRLMITIFFRWVEPPIIFLAVRHYQEIQSGPRSMPQFPLDILQGAYDTIPKVQELVPQCHIYVYIIYNIL